MGTGVADRDGVGSAEARWVDSLERMKKSNSSGNKYVLDLWARIGRLIT